MEEQICYNGRDDSKCHLCWLKKQIDIDASAPLDATDLLADLILFQFRFIYRVCLIHSVVFYFSLTLSLLFYSFYFSDFSFLIRLTRLQLAWMIEIGLNRFVNSFRRFGMI